MITEIVLLVKESSPVTVDVIGVYQPCTVCEKQGTQQKRQESHIMAYNGAQQKGKNYMTYNRCFAICSFLNVYQ